MNKRLLFIITIFLLLLSPMLSACKNGEEIDISVSAHATAWVKDKEVYEIRNSKSGELSAIIAPDKSDIGEKGWMRPRGNKNVAFTLYLNPEYDHEELRLEVSGILLTPLSVTPVKSELFTGGKEIKESVNTATTIRYCLDGNPIGRASVAFKLAKIGITQNCWAISSIVKGTLSKEPFSDTTGFESGFSEINKGDRVGKGVLGKDYNIVVDLKEAKKGRLITFDENSAEIISFELEKNENKYSAQIEGETVEMKVEFGGLVIKRQGEDSVTVMRFSKTPKGERD